MRVLRRAWVVVVGATACLAAGCRAPLAGGAAGGSGVARPAPGFHVTRRAESVPVTALAVASPYVWMGSAHGLRRWDVTADEGGFIGAETGLLGHAVSALAVDADGGVWVATEAGVGRLAPGAAPSAGAPARARLRYQAKGALGGITMLAPTRGDGGAWAAGPAGLFRLEGGGWTIFDFLRDVPVTSLDLDADGATVWVGTRGHGLYRVDRDGGRPVVLTEAPPPSLPGESPQEAAGGASDIDEIVGTATGSTGTATGSTGTATAKGTAAAPATGGVRVVAARAGGGGRIIFLNKDGPEVFQTQPGAGVRFVGLVSGAGGPFLIAGAPGAERIFTLRRLPRGEAPPAGGFRLVPPHKGTGDRFAAVPTTAAPPPDITIAVAGAAAGELWLGTRNMGVARAGAHGPQYLPGSELTDDADRVTVACAARDRCYVVTGGPHAWLYDGAGFRAATVGESPAGRALAVATDPAGAIIGLSWEPSFAGLVLTRLAPPGAPAAASLTAAKVPGPSDEWRPLDRVPLQIKGGRPVVSFVAFSPDGATLWVGLGAEGSDGQTQGRGAAEIALGTHKVIEHGAAAAAGKNPSPESLPLPYDLTGVMFDGTATWFSSHSGMARWQESELRRWGENERMDSETCYAVAKGPDGLVWAGTSLGVGRFDGRQWRFGDPDGAAAVATRAIVKDPAGRLWLATAKGLRVLGASAAAAGARSGPGAGQLVVDDDVLDATVDRFGRVWALGSSALAVVDTDGQNGSDVTSDVASDDAAATEPAKVPK